MLATSLPLVISTVLLFIAKEEKNPRYVEEERAHSEAGKKNDKIESFVFKLLLLSATLFGFSYYLFGFPIVTVFQSSERSVYAILTFLVYLSISAISGYLLGSLRGKRPL